MIVAIKNKGKSFGSKSILQLEVLWTETWPIDIIIHSSPIISPDKTHLGSGLGGLLLCLLLELQISLLLVGHLLFCRLRIQLKMRHHVVMEYKGKNHVWWKIYFVMWFLFNLCLLWTDMRKYPGSLAVPLRWLKACKCKCRDQNVDKTRCNSTIFPSFSLRLPTWYISDNSSSVTEKPASLRSGFGSEMREEGGALTVMVVR